jgi:diadenosine tetraphosphatase ApaH/serine/threonine PP2A family protein phosphatase
MGHDPVGVLERITALPNASFVRGNTERYVITGARPYPQVEDVVADPMLVGRLAEVEAQFAWCAGALTGAGNGWRDWLAALPAEVRTELPDGTGLLGVHASPGVDDGPGINDDPDDVLAGRLGSCGADVVLAGHTHRPVDRWVGPIRTVNLGSVSNPVKPDLRASYVIVDADERGHTIEHRRVAYDHDAVVAALLAQGHPGRSWLIKHQRGEVG